MPLLTHPVVVLKSAEAIGMIWAHPLLYRRQAKVLYMAGSRFQRAARAGKPHCTNTLQVCRSVMFAIVPLAKESHMTKSKVKVGGNYPSVLIQKGELL